MIKRDTISDILYELRDGKCHTYAELAEKAEVSLMTVRRCIESLRYRHPIEVFIGQRSDGRRGVQLEIFIDPALGGFASEKIALIIIGLIVLSDYLSKYKELCNIIIYKIKTKWKKDEDVINSEGQHESIIDEDLFLRAQKKEKIMSRKLIW